MALPTWLLYDAVYKRLTNADGVSSAASGYTWAQEDDDPGLPFGRVEPLFGADDSAKSTDTTTQVVQVDFFAAEGRTVREAMSAADTALMAGTGIQGSYSLTGFAVIGRPNRVDDRVIVDPTDEGAAPVRHGIARYEFRIQDIP